MAQKEEQGYGAMDPFGQFLMAAYLKGMVPGSQTSAYNTVLDLLSPGAVAGRQEAGVPNVAAQFEQMFGGPMLTPEEKFQMKTQAAGLSLTPQQQAEERTKMNQALAGVLAARGQGREAAEIGAETERMLMPMKQEAHEAQIGALKSQASMYDRSGKVDYTDPRVQAAMFQNNMNSIATTGRHWDHTTGQASDEMATPQQVQMAQILTGLAQTPEGGIASGALAVMLGQPPGSKAYEYAITEVERLTGLGWVDTWGPGGRVRMPGELTPENVEAIKERINLLQIMIDAGALAIEDTNINELKEQIGMPTEEPAGMPRGPMDFK
jgi:hypothetical protein